MFQLLWKFTSLLLGIPRNKFLGILKKKSLRQNFFTCLPAIASMEAFVVLEKPGGLPSRRIGAEAQGPGYQLVPRGACRHYPLGGGGKGHREWLFAQWKCLPIFFAGQLVGQTCSAGLAAESQPVRLKQGRWVGCVLTDCLWLIEGKILCIFWEKCQDGCVDMTPFSKIQL